MRSNRGVSASRSSTQNAEIISKSMNSLLIETSVSVISIGIYAPSFFFKLVIDYSRQ
ncbi:hypothetical protein V1T75_09225 [Tenacibaculum sp. FZY0031]|uniref:hypothetical protein n=1 Tax=Tenacibaculum sp. FZY0031 TaxID=3116648 RepID=UPI002EBAF2EB|nr:hypothetical protein [Tenacibaculum sp. FZY0031]